MTDSTVELADGRRCTVRQGGDSSGVPVVLHHGTPGSRHQAGLADEAARRHGVRLLSFDRPHDGPPSLAAVGHYTILVADALGLDRFAVAGVSGGGPYALATALAAPSRVTAVAVVAGIGPLRVIKPDDPDDPERAFLARADAGDLDGALAAFRDALADDLGDIRSIEDDADLVDAYIEGAPPADFAWLGPAQKRLWGQDLRAATRTLDGYARDNIAWGCDWDIDVAAVTVPVNLYYGEDDRLVPPSHGRWHAEQIPGSVLVTLPGAGHGTASFGSWDVILPGLRPPGPGTTGPGPGSG